MPALQLVIAPAAKADLKDIYQYGLRLWGKAQADGYLENLKKQFWSLTEQPLMGAERSELLVGGRSLAMQSHVLFYRFNGETVEIIRVLHGRQDPHRHLR